MKRVLASVLPLLLVSATAAFATQQVPERIVYEGRVSRIDGMPLEPLLAERGIRIRPGAMLSTDFYRGYLGTWLLEDDRLYLLSLATYEYEQRKGHTHPIRVEREIPLSEVFGDRPGPIPATWWTGQLKIPRGNLIRGGYRQNQLHEKTLYLNVEKGRVVRTLLVDNREEGRGRSPEDILWGLQADEPPADDGAWHDARTIGTEAFRKAVPVGTTFRTRGYLAVVQGFPPAFYVPATPATGTERFPLLHAPETGELGTCPHAELELVQVAIDGEIALRVRSWRPLEPGETMHHPGFPVPPVRVHRSARIPAGDQALDPNRGTKLEDDAYLHATFGRLVSIRGTLATDPVPNVHGVEVAVDEALQGKSVVAAGLLEKWIVTEGLLERHPDLRKRFATRGPGTWYRLVHPGTGALVRPTPAE